ncbi:MAG: DUF5333 family protein [Pseudomonadota bacterium]
MKLSFGMLAMIAAASTGQSAAAQLAAPDYYIEALFAVSTAEQLANFCPEIAFNLHHAERMSTALLKRLADDGIEGDALSTLNGVEAGVATLQDGFVARHSLGSPTGEAVCDVARSEIAEASAIGAYLKDVEK